MIKLDVDPWCHDCPQFKPSSRTSTLYADRFFEPMTMTETVVQCENREMYHKLIKYLKEKAL